MMSTTDNNRLRQYHRVYDSISAGHVPRLDDLLSEQDFGLDRLNDALAYAASCGQPAAFDTLVQHGAQLTYGPALVQAAANDRLDLVERLLAAGADPEFNNGAAIVEASRLANGDILEALMSLRIEGPLTRDALIGYLRLKLTLSPEQISEVLQSPAVVSCATEDEAPSLG